VVDITTVAFDPNQMATPSDTIAPGTIARTLQLLADEPNNELLGPFKASNTDTQADNARPMYF
jgi:hypothetical protein